MTKVSSARRLVLPHHTLALPRPLPNRPGAGQAGRVWHHLPGLGRAACKRRWRIKEYLPRDLAGRDADHRTIAAHSREDAENFAYGLGKFLEEARTLAQLDHPNLVRVRDFFEEHGTAYLVMDYYDGLTLAEYLTRQPGGKLPEDQAIGVLLPILDGLRGRSTPRASCTGTSSRRTSTSPPAIGPSCSTSALRVRPWANTAARLSVVLSEGYAPIEQYQRNGKQGPWTDVYGATAACISRMITGVDPLIALDRLGGTNDLSFHDQKLSENLELAIVGGLSVDAANRCQTIDILRNHLAITDSVLTPSLAIPGMSLRLEQQCPRVRTMD
jgi:serine/threonine protein kinase